MENSFFELVKAHLLEAQSLGNVAVETEVSLAKRFNVSRYKIRKVLDKLAQMGVLERTPRRGTQFKVPDNNTINEQLKQQLDVAGFDPSEYIEARIVIESAILPLIIRRITPAMLAKLEENLKKIEENASNPTVADQYDRDFHLMLLNACGNSVLNVFSGALVAFFDHTTDKLASYEPTYFLDIAEQQRIILNQIKIGNTERASKLLREHLLEKSQNI